MERGQIRFLWFKCAYKVIYLAFRRNLQVLTERGTLRTDYKENRGRTKPRELRRARKNRARPCNRVGTAVQRRSKLCTGGTAICMVVRGGRASKHGRAPARCRAI